MNPRSRICVAGGATLLGKALIERLQQAGYSNLVGTPPDEPDWTTPGQVEDFFSETRPEYVFHVAGKSGGIHWNQTRPAELMLDNLLGTAHLLQAAHVHGVTKLLSVASSCCYPVQAPQPLRVESLMTGPLEPTSAAYATAKLAGWQLCAAYRRQFGCRFITAIAANPFGPHDDFSPDSGHVIPALMRRMHEAKRKGVAELAIWGTGAARREFIYARDLADACLFVMRHYDSIEAINLGTGQEYSIRDAASAVARTVGYRGGLVFDPSQPEGAPHKCLDSTPLRDLGWRPTFDFSTALKETYDWFLHHAAKEDPRHARTAV
jgi:GDP-L-fucose synthase